MDFLFGVIGQALNMPIDEVRGLVYKTADDGTLTDELNPDAETQLTAKLSEHLQSVQKAARDQGHQRGTSEAATKVEKGLRQKFGLDSKLTGEALVDAVFERVQKAAETDEQKIKASPQYIQLERQLAEETARLLAAQESAVNEVKQQFERERAQAQFRNIAAERFRTLNPVLPQDQAKAQRQIDLFLSNALAGIEPQFSDAGEVVALLKDGQRVENAMKHPETLETFLKARAADYFDFQAQAPTGNAGNKPQVPDPQKPPTPSAYTGAIPANQQEFNKIYAELEGDPKAQEGLVAAFLTPKTT